MSRISESTWREIRTAYASGIGLREIARNMDIPAGTVLARSKREGWTRQIQHAKTLAQSSTTSQTVADAVAGTMAERGKKHLKRMAGIVERGTTHIENLDGDGILDRIDAVEKLDKVARRTYGLDTTSGEVRLNLYADFGSIQDASGYCLDAQSEVLGIGGSRSGNQ